MIPGQDTLSEIPEPSMRMIFSEKIRPNNAMEPRRVAVTDHAYACSAPATRLAHLGRSTENETGTDRPITMQLPKECPLECAPYGTHNVKFNREEPDPRYNLPGVPLERAVVFSEEVIANWPAVWIAARVNIDELLDEYEYGKDLEELIGDPNNSIQVLIMAPEGGERYRLDVFLNVGFEMGSHVFGVDFEELKAQEATATF